MICTIMNAAAVIAAAVDLRHADGDGVSAYLIEMRIETGDTARRSLRNMPSAFAVQGVLISIVTLTGLPL